MAKLHQKGEKAKYLEFLVDSGSDYLIISKSSAYLLGLDYNRINDKVVQLETANSSVLNTKKVDLILTIENQEFSVPVLVTNLEIENLLGRRGFFENFDVLFRERQKEIVLENNC